MQRDDERGDADRHPRRLQPGQVLRLRPGRVEADDEHVAEPVQQPGDRQERAVGVRREPPDGDVRGELEPQHHGQEGTDVGRDGGVLGQGGQDVGADGDERAEDDRARARCCGGPPGASVGLGGGRARGRGGGRAGPGRRGRRARDAPRAPRCPARCSRRRRSPPRATRTRRRPRCPRRTAPARPLGRCRWSPRAPGRPRGSRPVDPGRSPPRPARRSRSTCWCRTTGWWRGRRR